MTDIPIPEEAVEAAARAICAGNKWGEPCATPCSDCLPEARAAILAALRAWPGWEGSWTGDGDTLRRTIILPLPQETDND